MAINFQAAGTPVYGDFSFKNYHASVDIAAGVAVSVDSTNVLGGSANATWGPIDETGVIVVATEGDPIIGITIDIIKAGSTGRVRCYGIAPGIADGAITAGAWVMASATALKVGYMKAIGAAKNSAGIALNTTSADGEPVLVLLNFAKNA